MNLETPKKIVALGGGTGLPIVLKSLAADAAAGRISVTAIVNVADDGGSSGKLRKLLSTLPPGDIRNCLVATSRADPELNEIFNYRFATGGDLDNHSLGNLIIAALATKEPDFQAVIAKVSRLLNCWARIIPATNRLITLRAQISTGAEVYGQAQVATTRDPIEKVYIEPSAPPAPPDAIEAIGAADSILIGPGSLYSSIIPVLLIPDIREALLQSAAKKIYLCNTMSHRAENLGYTAQRHYEAIIKHSGGAENVCDYVVAQDPRGFTDSQLEAAQELGAVPVELPEYGEQSKVFPGSGKLRWITADIADQNRPVHHSPEKLYAALVLAGVI